MIDDDERVFFGDIIICKFDFCIQLLKAYLLFMAYFNKFKQQKNSETKRLRINSKLKHFHCQQFYVRI